MKTADTAIRIRTWALALASLAAATSAWASPHHRPAEAHLRPHHHHALRTHRVQRGMASYFSHRRVGKTTASGKPLPAGKLVAASKTLPLGTRAKVTNLETGKSVKVTVVDRGPYAKHRIIDVSPKAASKLGMKQDGVAPVKVKPLSVPASG